MKFINPPKPTKLSTFKSRIYRLIESILNFRWQIIIFLLIFPLLILLSFFSLLEVTQNNLFFMTIFLLNYYVAVFILIIIFSKVKSAAKARTPFYFIEKLHHTLNKDYPVKSFIGAEIGVYRGKNAKRIFDFLNIKHLVLVDPWAENIDPRTKKGLTASIMQEYYDEVKNKFSNNPEVRIIRDYSVNASKMFENEYFDFVYVDGDHTFEGVTKDLESWYPKLKKFGVMCGDDYGHPSGLGVIEAVTHFAYKNKLLVNYGEDNQFWFVKV